MHEYEFCLKRSGVWGGGRATWKLLDPICHLAWYVVNSAEEAPKWQRTRLVVHVNIDYRNVGLLSLTKPVSHTTYIPPHSVNTRPQGSYYIGNSTICDGTRSVTWSIARCEHEFRVRIRTQYQVPTAELERGSTRPWITKRSAISARTAGGSCASRRRHHQAPKVFTAPRRLISQAGTR